MSNSAMDSLKETVRDLEQIGLNTAFSKRDLKRLGIHPQPITISPEDIKSIRNSLNISQAVFASILDVNQSIVAKWEQGQRNPNGAARVLLDALKRDPHILDYRLTH
ncbi:MAG: helix-turn-helix domain-containing protein [Spirochaetales bacterium]|nr:helix-turn-helix domain-containing protein [Spirochaetales bacterium]